MVFSGRPSDACHACRESRRKCDRLRPGCTQCTRKRMACPGYRDLSNFYFRDESESVARKVRKQKSQAAAHDPPTGPAFEVLSKSVSPSAVDLEPQGSLSPTSPVSQCVPSSLTQSIDYVAITYFMSSYIVSSPFEWLTDLCGQSAASHSSLSAAIHAASVASLSLKLHDTDMIKTARSHYSDALAQTNKALACSVSAVQDSTLAAVLLLGLFEAIILSRYKSIKSWTAHTLGAVELLRLRGPKQFQSSLGVQLFFHTSNNIRTSCAQRGVNVPSEFLDMHQESLRHMDNDNPRVRLGPLVDKVAVLRSRLVGQGNDQERNARVETVQDALDIEKEVNEIMDSVPEDWRWSPMSEDEIPNGVYMGLAHRYPSQQLARLWNAMRIIRMYVNDLICVEASYLLRDKPCSIILKFDDQDDIHLAELRATSLVKVAETVRDTLASVPHFMDPFTGEFLPSARSLIWPLSILTEMKFCLPSERRAAVQYLYKLGQDACIPQAVQAAKMADEGVDDQDWLHVYHLG